MSGVELITKERERQIKKEKWSLKHDDKHTRGELVLAAISYAAPERIYVQRQVLNGIALADPFPWHQGGRGYPAEGYDKRYEYGECRDNSGNVLPDPSTYNAEERLDLLVKAGALIAAEIDRIQRTSA